MKKLKTFYDDRQSVEKNNSFSPSAGKPAKLIEQLTNKKIPVEITSFEPCTKEDLKLIHNGKYIDGLFNGTSPNGFGNTDIAIAESVLWTTGSIVSATMYALKHKENTFSPTSGFHHATQSSGGAFCTVNGLMVAAIKALAAGAIKVGILDLDAHYGNGQVDIINKLGLQDVVQNYCFSGNCDSSKHANKWLAQLPFVIKSMRDCSVIIFQAGADPYINDPLGGILTMEQLKLRDQIVFREAQQLGIPVAHNLAGGYTNPFSEVLEIHENTVLMSLEYPQKNKNQPREVKCTK